MEPDDLLNKALVADRHRMGERIARQDRDGSYRDRKAGHERPVSPSPSGVEKSSGHSSGSTEERRVGEECASTCRSRTAPYRQNTPYCNIAAPYLRSPYHIDNIVTHT